MLCNSSFVFATLYRFMRFFLNKIFFSLFHLKMCFNSIFALTAVSSFMCALFLIFRFIFLFLFISFLVFFCISSAPTKSNGLATPLDVTGLSQNELQALLLGSHPSTQSVNVKREPEDLRKDPKCSRNQKVMYINAKYFSLYCTVELDVSWVELCKVRTFMLRRCTQSYADVLLLRMFGEATT